MPPIFETPPAWPPPAPAPLYRHRQPAVHGYDPYFGAIASKMKIKSTSYMRIQPIGTAATASRSSASLTSPSTCSDE